MTDWQPIHTAPWDTDILLGWRNSFGAWTAEVGWAGKKNTCDGGYSNGWQHGNATHWMPLPQPPMEG